MDITDARLSSRAAPEVTALYAEHALGLVRLAILLVGDRASAEDVVQDAFLGLYRRWDRLPDTSAPLAYVRVSVLNGCRTALRRRSRARQASSFTVPPPAESAGALALLRYYLDLSEAEIAAAMGISKGTVKSATSRALAAIGRILQEES